MIHADDDHVVVDDVERVPEFAGVANTRDVLKIRLVFLKEGDKPGSRPVTATEFSMSKSSQRPCGLGTASRRRGPSGSVRPREEEGTMGGTRILWSRPRNVPHCPTPLLYEGVIYLLVNGGILTTLDPNTVNLPKLNASPEH